ncbi:MAG: hypothetical protein ACLRWQ_05790 [Flavonifractor plautii]
MKKRIIGATLITVVCALLMSNLAGVLLFRSREMDAARNTLQELLVLMDAQSAITDPDGLAQQFHAAAPDKRLTIIDTDGTVLADTEANPQTLEDHNSRPEVEQAAATGWGEAVRHSETLGTSMFYVSKRFADGMVGRASMPLSSIDSLVWNGVWGFLIASAAGLLLALDSGPPHRQPGDGPTQRRGQRPPERAGRHPRLRAGGLPGRRRAAPHPALH